MKVIKMGVFDELERIKELEKDYGTHATPLIMGQKLILLSIKEGSYFSQFWQCLIMATLAGIVALITEEPIILVVMAAFTLTGVFCTFISMKCFFDKREIYHACNLHQHIKAEKAKDVKKIYNALEKKKVKK